MLTVDTPAEWALYALAVRNPELMDEAERFVGGMLAENQPAIQRVKALLAPRAGRFDHFTVGELQALVFAFAEAYAYDSPPPRPWDHPVWRAMAVDASATLDRAAADEGWDERTGSPASGGER